MKPSERNRQRRAMLSKALLLGWTEYRTKDLSDLSYWTGWWVRTATPDDDIVNDPALLISRNWIYAPTIEHALAYELRALPPDE
jgi:hypothetical protein